MDDEDLDEVARRAPHLSTAAPHFCLRRVRTPTSWLQRGLRKGREKPSAPRSLRPGGHSASAPIGGSLGHETGKSWSREGKPRRLLGVLPLFVPFHSLLELFGSAWPSADPERTGRTFSGTQPNREPFPGTPWLAEPPKVNSDGTICDLRLFQRSSKDGNLFQTLSPPQQPGVVVPPASPAAWNSGVWRAGSGIWFYGRCFHRPWLSRQRACEPLGSGGL